jgi:hypothetical protein
MRGRKKTENLNKIVQVATSNNTVNVVSQKCNIIEVKIAIQFSRQQH